MNYWTPNILTGNATGLILLVVRRNTLVPQNSVVEANLLQRVGEGGSGITAT